MLQFSRLVTVLRINWHMYDPHSIVWKYGISARLYNIWKPLKIGLSVQVVNMKYFTSHKKLNYFYLNKSLVHLCGDLITPIYIENSFCRETSELRITYTCRWRPFPTGLGEGLSHEATPWTDRHTWKLYLFENTYAGGKNLELVGSKTGSHVTWNSIVFFFGNSFFSKMHKVCLIFFCYEKTKRKNSFS